MSGPVLGVLGFALALALILLRVPVAVAMGVVGAAGFGLLNGWPALAFILARAPFEAVFPYSLSVIPLFLAMGVFAARAGLSGALFLGVNALVGRFRGGLAMASIGACAGFGAICGSSLATAATMCRVALPEMRARGYDDRLAAACLAAGGTLGVLIPPSILLVIYGLLTEQSIGALFAAGLVPGLLGTLLYMGAVAFWVRVRPQLAPPGAALAPGEGRRAMVEMWPVASLFTLVIGGLYAGWFSPTEAAAVGAFGAVLLAFVRRALSRAVLAEGVLETAATTGMIFTILIGAALFNYFIETTGLPQWLIAQVEGARLGPVMVLLLVLLFYLVLGCFMDALSMILLTVPFVFPLVAAQGYDPIWFGVILVTVAEIGLITPPIGMNLFVIQATAGDLKLGTIVRGMPPFLVADLVRLVLLVLFPGLALWLPGLLG